MKNFKGGSGGFGGGGQRFGGGANKNSQHNGGGKFGGGQSRGLKGGDRSKDRNERGEMFSAICSNCGKSCEVPFRPSPDKPVFCSACFGKMGQDGAREYKNGDRREPEFKRDARPSREEKPMRHEGHDAHHGAGTEELKRQLSSLEGKVNRILDMLNAQMHEIAEAVIMPAVKEAKKEQKVKSEKVATTPAKKVAKKTPKVIAKVTKKVAKKAKK